MRMSSFAVLSGALAVLMTLVGSLAAIEDPEYAGPVAVVAAVLLSLGLLSGIEAFLGATTAALGFGFAVGGTADFGSAAAGANAVLVVIAATRVCWEARRPARVTLGAQRSVMGGYVLVVAVVVGAAAFFRAITDTRPPEWLVAVGVLAAAVPLFGLWAMNRGMALGGRTGRLAVATGLAVVLAVAIGAAATSRAERPAGTDTVAEEERRPEAAATPSSPEPGAGGDAADEDPQLADRLLAIAGIFLVLAIMILLTTNLLRDQPIEFKPTPATPGEGDIAMFDRRVGDPVSEVVTPSQAAAVVSDALDAVESVTDPRRAVRLAYATVERGFGQLDARRRSAESEAEYLERLLPRLGVSAAALRDLTSLFERARFSTHDIDAAMRDDAIAALQVLRAELGSQTAPATRAGPAGGAGPDDGSAT